MGERETKIMALRTDLFVCMFACEYVFAVCVYVYV